MCWKVRIIDCMTPCVPECACCVAQCARMIHIDVDLLVSSVVANIIVSLNGVGEDEGMPSSIRLSYARLKDHGAYVLENGHEMFLWVGKAVRTN